MSNPDGVSPFADNWAYLKTELSWLDRLLMVAVSRQKRDLQDLDDFALSEEDRVTSHWWKGIITLNGQPGYDLARPPKLTQTQGGGYAQHLEARIQASQRQGIVLALPWLRDQLQLSQFEKNVILLALAPEINQRFGRLYSYLQYQHDESDWDLPTVDLCLRLLCRNDQEWRTARPLIAPDSRLVSLGLVEWVNADDTTLLSRHLRLTEDLTTYLLSELPDPGTIEHLARPGWGSRLLQPLPPGEGWASLVLPEPTLTQLKTLTQGTVADPDCSPLVLFAGAAGTGKTLAAQVLGAALALPVVRLDLAAIQPDQLDSLGDDLAMLPPGLLLVKSAPSWFGRSPLVELALVQQWVNQRRNQPGLTILTTHYLQAVKPSWRRAMDGVIEFPYPTETARQDLWRQAIPNDLKVDRRVRWPQVAQQLTLTGGGIATLAKTAVALAQQTTPATLTPDCLHQALALHQPGMTLQLPQRKSRKNS
ncbi:MAG: hypothetical protein ACFCVD_22705 [Nodosilinea sp.]